MTGVGVDFGGLLDLDGAIARGRAAAMPKMAAWVAAKVRENIAAQRDPWGGAWRPKSSQSDGGAGAALLSLASRVREESTDTTWNVVIDDPHASSHNFGRASAQSTRNSRAFRRARRRNADYVAPRAVSAKKRQNAGEPIRAMLPLRAQNSGRSEPKLDMPPEWEAALQQIIDEEIQREIDALSAPR